MSRKSQLALTMNALRARLAEDERGATAIEYALLASGIGGRHYRLQPRVDDGRVLFPVFRFVRIEIRCQMSDD
jgi:hypothetical protein